MKLHLKKTVRHQRKNGKTGRSYLLLIDISNPKKYARELIQTVSDTSWINGLDPIAKTSYEATAKRTITALVNIFGKVNNRVTKEFGEYMVSLSAANCLETHLNHKQFPISELWKEKLLGNHGFDFHTETSTNWLAFGEAKYSSKSNGGRAAVKQVLRFIKEEKDQNDANHLRNFASSKSLERLLQRKRAFSLAFSINSKNHALYFKRYLKSDLVKNLQGICNELFIIGIKA